MKLVTVSDIHISVRDSKLDFERTRIQALGEHLVSQEGLRDLPLVLLGDTFDKSRPNLEELSVFYQFLEKIKGFFSEIIVVSGNHDPLKLWKLLPKSLPITLIDCPTYLHDVLFVTWEHIHNYTKDLQEGTRKPPSTILFSHARCSLGSLIQEELSMETLSKSFDLTILGDIHKFHSPFPNIHYCSQTSSSTFEKHQEGTKGYLIVDTETLEVTEVPLELPRRELIVTEDLSLSKLKLDKSNLYKLRLIGNLEELQKVDKRKYPNAVFEFIPTVTQAVVSEEYREQLTKSVYEQLQMHMKKFRYSEETMREAINLLKQAKGTK